MKVTEKITSKWTLEPFPPGHYEEYEILDDGRTKLLSKFNYHKPGDKPSFQTHVPSNGLLKRKTPVINFIWSKTE